MPYDVFISYASPDLRYAEELHNRLEQEGFKVWFDRARLSPGFDWHHEIEQGCENSRVMLPVLTPLWKNSDWTKFETYGAGAVIPLIFDSTWPDVSTPPLERFQAEKVEFTLPATAQWPKLIVAIRRALAEPLPNKNERIYNLRYRANDYFVGREKELIHIHEELHCNPRAVLTQGRVRAIAAMGGAGKTTLARQYAEKFWRCYPQMFWVDCRIGFELEFAHIHDILFPEKSNVGLKDADKAALALQELSGTEARLLILDNAEDETSAMKWIPKTGGCHTLITSRFSGWSSAVRTIHLFVLEKKPAIDFLQRRASRQAAGADLASCELLAEKRGYLPLALEQAAAYVEQQGAGFGFADYVRLYDEAASDLLAVGALGSTEYPDSVIATWKPTIEKLSPEARSLLRLCAFFAATHIPIKMMIEGANIVLEMAAHSRFRARRKARMSSSGFMP
jgi:hypothetical protein